MVFFFGSGIASQSTNVELYVGDSPIPTQNMKVGGPVDRIWPFKVSAHGKYVFLRRTDQGSELGITQVIVFSDCDCRDLNVDVS